MRAGAKLLPVWSRRSRRPVSSVPGSMQPRHWLEAAAWSVGLGLLASYGVMYAWAEHARVDGIAAFRELRSETATLPHSTSGAQLPAPDQSLWSGTRVRAFRRSASPELPEGVLRVPALRIEVPIYAGTSEHTLDRGAGHIEGTASLEEAGNVGIAAHRDGFFRALKDAQPGQLVYLETRTRTVRYRIVQVDVVKPSDLAVLAATAIPSVTLVTCYPFYFVGPAPQRFIVRAQMEASVARSRTPDVPTVLTAQE